MSSIELAEAEPVYGTWVNAAGWGRDSDEATGVSSVLNKVQVKVANDTEANNVFGDEHDWASKGLLFYVIWAKSQQSSSCTCRGLIQPHNHFRWGPLC